MIVVEREFEADSVKLIPLGDLHIGSEADIETFTTIMASNKDAYFVLVGDLLDNALITSVGNVYQQKMSPQEATDVVVEILKAFKDRILGVVNGNHERRTMKAAGIDILHNVCQILEIPYSNTFMVLDVAIKNGNTFYGSKRRQHYAVLCHHGIAGGRFAERSTRQNRMINEVFEGVDVVITGHTHQPTVDYFSRYVYDAHNKCITKSSVVAVTVGAWNEEEYAREKALPPSPKVLHEIVLHAKRKKLVTVNTFVVR